MQSKYQLKNIDWVNTLFLTLTPVAAVVFTSLHLMTEKFNWGAFAVAVVFYLFTGFSITAGYHRLFSHKSYKANPMVRLFFLIFGAATFQNSLLKWASDHRKHHSKVDTPNDPYNIKEGFFYAHMGWIFLKNDAPIEGVNDLKADPMVMWQHKYYLAISTFFGIVLPALLGWYFGSLYAGLGIAAFGRVVFVHHVTFFINSLCHFLGKQTYSDKHTARDSVIMAFLTYGEGYHNFHHEFQIDYRNGIRWYHFDPTKWLINFFQWAGLAWDLKTAPESEILKAELIMKEKQLCARVNTFDLEELRERVVATLKTLDNLKKEYKLTKFNTPAFKKQFLLKIKAKQQELKHNLQLWNNLYTQMQLA